MGFLDSIFGGDKPTQKNIDKLVQRVKERYAQPEYRREAMDKLLDWGTPESLLGGMQRFTVVAQSPHWDEEEKRWLVDELAHKGEPARAALKTFMAKENHIAFPARALSRLAAGSYVDDLCDALQARPPEDHRSTQGKSELVAALGETGDARVADALIPYLDDHGDDVQCACVDAFDHLWDKLGERQGAVTAKLQTVVTDDARSARVLRHAAAFMAKRGVAIDATKALAPAVAEDFVVKDGKLAKS